MRDGYWKIGTWQNIPFYVHWTVLLWIPLYWQSYQDPAWLLLSMAAFLGLLFVHEAGHAVAAMSCGLRVHAIEAHLFHGLCWHEAAYRERDDVLVAWGGVLAQFFVLVVAVLVQNIMRQHYPDFAYALAPLFYVLIKANLVIIGINLLPVAPLDGHRAWRALPMVLEHFSGQGGARSRQAGNVSGFDQRGGVLDQLRRIIARLLDSLKGK